MTPLPNTTDSSTSKSIFECFDLISSTFQISLGIHLRKKCIHKFSRVSSSFNRNQNKSSKNKKRTRSDNHEVCCKESGFRNQNFSDKWIFKERGWKVFYQKTNSKDNKGFAPFLRVNYLHISFSYISNQFCKSRISFQQYWTFSNSHESHFAFICSMVTIWGKYWVRHH